MMKLITTLLTSILLLSTVELAAQDTDALSERIDLQRYEFPQEKIHVMTDRGNYLAGDTIWLRAWVVDAATHHKVDASQFVYVTLVSPTDSVQNLVKIHCNADGVFEGYLPLDIDIPEGRYQLSAYTMFMQSIGAEYFYSQPIEVTALPSLRQRIVSKCMRYKNEVDITLSYENIADGSPCTYRLFGYQSSDGKWYEQQYGGRNKEVHLTLKGDDAQMPALLVAFDNYSKYIQLPPREMLDVTFYPEGGYLVPGVENAVAFKLTNTNGTILSGEGELVDQDGHRLAALQVEHDGMGIARFTPQANQVYTARWHDSFDQEVTFALPQVRPEATVLQVHRNADGSLTVRAAGAQASGGLVVLQQRGRMLAAGYGEVVVNEAALPAGVVQAILLDSELRCLSERLFYIHGNLAPMPQVATDRASYSDREPVTVDVDLSGIVAGEGDCAVSVIDVNAGKSSEGNILVNLLLQSDLRGRINQPEYYFTEDDSTSADTRMRHLDMLMLTQGWRRYDIPRVLRGRLAEPQYPIEASQVVTGRVLSDWRKKPVAGANVSLIAPRVEFSTTAVTDSLGEFAIALPLLPDSVDCIVMAENIKGKKQMNLELDKEVFPQVYHVTSNGDSPTTPATIIDEQQWRLEKGGDWRHIILNELLVTARRPRLHSNERNPYSLTSSKIAKMDIRSLDAAARALPGLVTLNGELYTAGGTAKDRVYIIVDGEPVNKNFTSDDEALKMLEESTRVFPQDPIYREPDSSIFWPSGLGEENHYDLPEMSIAESMVSFKDLDYIYFARKPHGGGTLIIQHKEGYHANGRKEPSVYLKITQPMGAQRPAEFYSPRYDDSNSGFEPGTDLRTTLYWNPCVAVDAQGKSTFDFYASDAHSTRYLITVEGITSDGTPFRATHEMTKR